MATEATTDTSALAAAKRKEFTRSMIELAGMLPVLILICILFAVLTPNFLTQNNIVNVVRQASINIVLAAGMTFVILREVSIWRSDRCLDLPPSLRWLFRSSRA